MTTRKDTQKFLRDLEQSGYIVEKTKKNHLKVRMSKDRQKALEEQGFDTESCPPFVVFSSTPSDYRSMRNSMAVVEKRLGLGWSA